jgi:hypothetical protein
MNSYPALMVVLSQHVVPVMEKEWLCWAKQTYPAKAICFAMRSAYLSVAMELFVALSTKQKAVPFHFLLSSKYAFASLLPTDELKLQTCFDVHKAKNLIDSSFAFRSIDTRREYNTFFRQHLETSRSQWKYKYWRYLYLPVKAPDYVDECENFRDTFLMVVAKRQGRWGYNDWELSSEIGYRYADYFWRFMSQPWLGDWWPLIYDNLVYYSYISVTDSDEIKYGDWWLLFNKTNRNPIKFKQFVLWIVKESKKLTQIQLPSPFIDLRPRP